MEMALSMEIAEKQALEMKIDPRGVLPNKEVGGGLDLTSSLEAKLGARSGQVHKIRGILGSYLKFRG